MADIINTAELEPRALGRSRDAERRLWIYNGLDCLVTAEVAQKVHKRLDEVTGRVYAFEMAMRAPALAMMLRGMLVDQSELGQQLHRLRKKWNRIHEYFLRLTDAAVSEEINYRSPMQLKKFFYQQLKFPKQYTKVKGKSVLSVGREPLEKLSKANFYGPPLANCVLMLRDIDKQIQVLNSEIDPDGRLRASFNPSATETGRWSSSKNCFGGGTNMQNITEEMRRIFIADDGWKLAYPDLEQAESRAVAYLADDGAYIEACESSDLHTTVARMVWPELEWTDDPIANRKIADRPYYRHFSRRDLSKRGGHASNYMATAWTLSRALQIEQQVAEDFQARYFAAFRGIRFWHQETQRLVQSEGVLVTPLGRKRTFFARRHDDSTIREAVAYVPQSTVAELLNLGLYRVYSALDLHGKRVQVLNQVHDGFVFQFRTDDYEVLPEVLRLMTIPITVGKRIMTIPVNLCIGFVWHKKLMAAWDDPEAKSQERPVQVDMLDWNV